MNFVDEVDIHIKAGDGGRGIVSFLRERSRPMGGPDGGDGGKGGDVIFQTTTSYNTLFHLRYKRKFLAQDGKPGRGKHSHGKNGEDIIIYVPCGTIIKDKETDIIIADLVDKDTKFIIAKGGIGGKGNAHFLTSTRQTPRFAQTGREGEEKFLKLELKILADIGLVGLPNAGKSTFLSKVTAAKPKIADYPFTTLVPNLGVVSLSDDRTMVIADIPGLIEGAHTGIGMGHEFLRHIERTRALLFIIDPIQNDTFEQFSLLKKELLLYNLSLSKKDIFVAINKTDILDKKEVGENLKKFHDMGQKVYAISAIKGEGLTNLLEDIYKSLQNFHTNE